MLYEVITVLVLATEGPPLFERVIRGREDIFEEGGFEERVLLRNIPVLLQIILWYTVLV